MRASLLLGVLAVVGCKGATPPQGFGVDLTIDATGLTSRGALVALDVSTSGAETFDQMLTTNVLAQSGVVRTRYRPGVGAGSLTFVVEVFDASHTELGAGTTSVTLVPGQAVLATVTLTDIAAQHDLSTGDAAMYPATCSNQTLDPGEIDIDCGGDCPGCEPGKKCTAAKDCATNTCDTTNHCELASGPPGWLMVGMLPGGRLQASAAMVDDQLYVAGGFSTAGYAADTFRYDAASDAWCGTCTPAPGPLVEARGGFGLVAASGYLFAMGGAGLVAAASSPLASVERFDPGTMMWTTQLGGLSTPRINFGATFSPDDGAIYVVGGQNTINGPIIATVEAFMSTNPVVTTTTRPALPLGRAYPGVATDAMGRVLAIGGAAATNVASAEVDQLVAGATSWTTIAPLNAGRVALNAALAPDGRVYAVGGQDGTGASLGIVEALRLDADHWTMLPPITARSTPAVAVGSDGRVYAATGRLVDGTGAFTPIVEAYGPVLGAGTGTGSAGDAIAITASNFAAGANITVTFSGDAKGVVAVSGTTDATGALSPSLVWHVSSVTAGTYYLTGVDDRARYPVRTTFVVK